MKQKTFNDLTLRKVLIFSFLIYFPLFSFTQGNYLYIGNNKYPVSEYLKFQSKKSIQVRFAIKDQGGFIELSYYGGDVNSDLQIFLEDGNFIKCFDYGYRDEVDNKESSIYKLTEKELLHLADIDIDKIRFKNYNSDYFAHAKFEKKVRSKTNYNKFETITINNSTSKVIKTLIRKYRNENQNYDFNALFGAAENTNVKKEQKVNNKSIITLKPNNVEAGRKYGNKREPEISGQINTMTIEFSRNNVKIYDDAEQSNFEVISYEWMDNNKLWIDFSTKPLEFYMVIVFDIDGLVFVNNENDPQPGEEYKSLYFKELSRSEFKNIYK